MKIKNVKDQNNRKSKCIVEKMPHLSSFLHYFKREQYFLTRYLKSVYTNIYRERITSALNNGIKLILQNKFNEIFYYDTEKFQIFLVLVM